MKKQLFWVGALILSQNLSASEAPIQPNPEEPTQACTPHEGVVYQKFNGTLLLISNASGIYQAYKWYKNGVQVSPRSATDIQQDIVETPRLDFTAQYVAMAQDRLGRWTTFCPYTPR